MIHVTTHAARQYRRRIDRCDEAAARAAIVAGLQAPCALRRVSEPGGATLFDVGCKAPNPFVATVERVPDGWRVLTVTYATRGRARPGRYTWDRATWTPIGAAS